MLIVNPTANPSLSNSNSLKSLLETIRFTYKYENKGVRNFF